MNVRWPTRRASSPSVSLHRVLVVLLLTACFSPLARAAEVRVAVASNFLGTAKELGDRFAAKSGHRVLISAGSTGKLYAQILKGAPFDVLLAADTRRPRLLEERGAAVAGTRFTYAVGRLALWGPGMKGPDDGGEVLRRGGFRRLAIANPKLAPYGLAAEQTLKRLKLLGTLRPKLVFGENIGQALQFVASGNAELGLLALSQLVDSDAHGYWLVPQGYYQPIEQQAVALAAARNPETARAFLDFLRTSEAHDLIGHHGYAVPTQTPEASVP